MTRREIDIAEKVPSPWRDAVVAARISLVLLLNPFDTEADSPPTYIKALNRFRNRWIQHRLCEMPLSTHQSSFTPSDLFLLRLWPRKWASSSTLLEEALKQR
jgi:hypothetical protein